MVGGSVSELLRTVSAGVGYLRGTVGICGVLLLLYLLLPTVIRLFMVRLTWQLSASLADMLGCNTEKKLLEESSSLNGFLIAAVSICSSVLLLSLTCVPIAHPQSDKGEKMKSYFFSLISASFVVAIVGILAPNAKNAKVLRLLTSLFLVCILVLPFRTFIKEFASFLRGDIPLLESETDAELNAEEQFQRSVNDASKTYFTQSLTHLIEEKFSIKTGNVSCKVRWEEGEDSPVPAGVVVLLSGSAIWKNTAEIEEYITDLLNCPCNAAIE